MSAQEKAQQERRIRLARRFRKQQLFTQVSSPLAACLCGVMADWLDAASGENEISVWLLAVSRHRESFAVPMLLLAAIHREILRRNPDYTALAAYFPTAGGRKAIDVNAIGAELERLILAHRRELAVFLQSATVQTNETARGLCWLLPALYIHWPEMVLVDLGCSAGLNLVADSRHYCLQEALAPGEDFEVGGGASPQFVVTSEGPFVTPDKNNLPKIGARLGCDQHPFLLTTAEDELNLAAFVWGDQLQRLTRLQEGIAALHQAQKKHAPVQLIQATLPEDLASFLKEQLTTSFDRMPVLLYNTYLTPYLADKGHSLREKFDQWAACRPEPVLWLQWELLQQGLEPPELGWLGWTAELWCNGCRYKWHLAWVHPHGSEVRWMPDLVDWANFWRSCN
ncbi:MAG: DUF2332 family protein [Desulfobulbus sp.]|nr:DUF2332 family protein [Desulfobulbus sp.]